MRNTLTLACVQPAHARALTIRMSRDGSSGGVIRMAIITQAGVERYFVPNPELPDFGGAMGAKGMRPPPSSSTVPITA